MRGWFAPFAAAVAALALLAGGPGAVKADTVYIDVESNFFDQAEVYVYTGDTVCWTFNNGIHTTTSVDGLWDSGVLGAGSTFEYTFTDPGDYIYTCTLHFNCCGMAGVVHVVDPCPCPG
jgi:plastocyanin